MDEKQLIIKSRLEYDWDFCSLCLLKLYEQQTDDEQGSGDTHHENGKGFTKADAFILSSIVHNILKQMERTHEPELEQCDIDNVRTRLKKYTKQLTTLLTDDEIES